MNDVYFVRHGENPANITREFSHRLVDYPLTGRGVEQAQATGYALRDVGITAVYSSPLRRALQTAEIIAAHLGLPVTTIEAFREVNVGALETQPPCEETWALHDSIFAHWHAGRAHIAFPGGENHTTLSARMRQGLMQALEGRDEERVVIVAHGGILAATARTFCDNLDQTPAPHIPNCAITRMRLEARGAVIRGTLEAWAECGHLSDEQRSATS